MSLSRDQGEADAVNLVEIFSSVQGEGTNLGSSTLFLRLGGCDLRCRWCDTPESWRPVRNCRIETLRGSGSFESVPNPISVSAALAAADGLDLASHAYASITGGEPLLQPGAVLALARAIRARGTRVQLETHGLATRALERVVEAVDLVSMDWKLASDVRRASDPRPDAAASFHDEHESFLAVAVRAPEVQVKVVITRDSRDEEIDEVCGRVSRSCGNPTLVIQPVTPAGGVGQAPGAQRLLSLLERIERQVPGARLIPQTHRLIGVP